MSTAIYTADRAEPLEFITPKDPDDTVPITLNLTNEMSELSDTISTATATAETGLSVNSYSNTTTAITAIVAGGAAGKTYEVAFQAVTAGGLTLNYTGVVRVASR